jgi:hypothetical protein
VSAHPTCIHEGGNSWALDDTGGCAMSSWSGNNCKAVREYLGQMRMKRKVLGGGQQLLS